VDRDRLLAQLRALGEVGRLDLALTLAGGEHGVAELMAALGLTQPNLSRQIKVLREAGVVVERRVGRQVFYRLADNELARTVVRLGARSAPAGASEGGTRAPGSGRERESRAVPPNMREFASGDPGVSAPSAPDPEEPPSRNDFEEWLL